jgi:F-type H+-transporting ATPase subunit delta
MKISKAARREAKQLLRSCQVQGVLDENRVRQTVQRVIASQPRGYLAILSQFQRWVKLELERRTARIDSATPLPQDMEANLRDSLSRTYGPGLNFLFTHNPALIAGVRIKVGSDVYDGSVQARLAALEQSL